MGPGWDPPEWVIRFLAKITRQHLVFTGVTFGALLLLMFLTLQTPSPPTAPLPQNARWNEWYFSRRITKLELGKDWPYTVPYLDIYCFCRSETGFIGTAGVFEESKYAISSYAEEFSNERMYDLKSITKPGFSMDMVPMWLIDDCGCSDLMAEHKREIERNKIDPETNKLRFVNARGLPLMTPPVLDGWFKAGKMTRMAWTALGANWPLSVEEIEVLMYCPRSRNVSWETAWVTNGTIYTVSGNSDHFEDVRPLKDLYIGVDHGDEQQFELFIMDSQVLCHCEKVREYLKRK